MKRPPAPLDELGAALRAVYVEARHDIDWTGHPLMRIYQQAGLGHLNQNMGRIDTRTWRQRRKPCSR